MRLAFWSIHCLVPFLASLAFSQSNNPFGSPQRDPRDIEREKQCKGFPAIPFSRAESRLTQKVPPAYLEIAKKIGFEGSVVLEVCVGESGEVLRAKFVSGHPFLVVEAIKVVNQWKFESGSTFRTSVTVDFSLGSSKAEIAKATEIGNEYFANEQKCREAHQSRNLDAALNYCKTALELVNQLPAGHQNERRNAHGLLSRVYFARRSYSDSLAEAKSELESGWCP